MYKAYKNNKISFFFKNELLDFFFYNINLVGVKNM